MLYQSRNVGHQGCRFSTHCLILQVPPQPKSSQAKAQAGITHFKVSSAKVIYLSLLKPSKTHHEPGPKQTVAGLPFVTRELMWNEEAPFITIARLGALRLGPAAGDLKGARIVAEFIAGKISQLLGLHEDGGSVDMISRELGMEN